MSDYMPEEVILKILNGLPVKSLMRFRSVSKSWNTLISHPSFISTHLQASHSRPPNNTPFLLLRYEENGRKNYSLNCDNDGFDEFNQLRLSPFDFVSDYEVRGSCNGLICLHFWPFDYLDLILWNPSIRRYISLPRPIISESVLLDVQFGFGFDSRTNDYKLLMVGVEEENGSWIKPYLFSLNQNCWKRVSATIPPNYTFDIDEVSLLFANGALHWLVFHERPNDEYNNAILGFDLSAEDFFEIKLPQSSIGLNPLDLLIKKYGESSIALLKRDYVNHLEELWVMKEYGVVDSWTKVLTLTSNIHIRWWPKVLGFRKNGEALSRVSNGKIASLDLNSQQSEPHGVEGVEVATGKISFQGTYVESLVLLDKAVNVHSENDVNHPIYSIDSSRIYRRIQVGELMMWQTGVWLPDKAREVVVLKILGQKIPSELRWVPNNEAIVGWAPRNDGVGGGIINHIVSLAQERRWTVCTLHRLRRWLGCVNVWAASPLMDALFWMLLVAVLLTPSIPPLHELVKEIMKDI
ncbi:hypothetical protein V6N11_079222 [Hibiscus sabdariffa]|uniref:F-box domain-containing protein n=1 Tax=Hibiscus sabdariffa TaxID=183260 RepID=A0ABR2RUS3_9ROSI